jgi:hypothetical protein
MSEMTYFDEEIYREMVDLVRDKLDRYAREVVNDIKSFPREARLSGDDSGLESFWEEFKYQVQREESHCFEVYVETFERQCQFVVEELPRDEQGLLWLRSDGYWDCDFQADYEGKIPYGDTITEAVARELYRRVVEIAENEELKFDPDFPPEDEEDEWDDDEENEAEQHDESLTDNHSAPEETLESKEPSA